MDELEQIAKRYLLGEMSEEEQAALEEKYFSDPNVFNQVLQVESELVDAYARGQLPTEMRVRFEHSYLKHPARQKRVEFARALTTRIDERERSVARVEQSPQSASPMSWNQRLLAIFGGRGPTWQFAMAVIVLLIAVGGVWILVNSRWRQQQRETAQQREQTTTPKPTQTPQPTGKEERTAQTQPETSQPSPAAITSPAPRSVTLALTVGGVRGADSGPTQTLVIPPEITQAQILLNLKDDSYPRYRVSLRKIGGSEIFTQTNIRPHSTKAGPRFLFTIPARQFTSGDYTLTLSGITPDGDIDDLSKSLFRVETK